MLTERLDILESKMDMMLSLINKVSSKGHELGDYLEEKEAMKLLQRGTTWFYEVRKKGKLPFSKVGRKTYYRRQDIIAFLDEHLVDGFNTS